MGCRTKYSIMTGYVKECLLLAAFLKPVKKVCGKNNSEKYVILLEKLGLSNCAIT